MVDNWFMEDIVEHLQNGVFCGSRSYLELLNAIILWDEIVYPVNNYNWWRTVPSEVQNVLICLDDHEETGKNDARVIARKLGFFDGNVGMTPDADDRAWMEWRLDGLTNAISEGAIRYSLLSQQNGCDYLPCIKRREYVQAFLSRKGLFRLNTIMNFVDEEIKTYYRNLFQESELNAFTFDIPLLARYILENTPHGQSPIDFAQHIKHEGPVLDLLEACIGNGDMKEYRKLRELSKQMIWDVLMLDRKRLSFSASLSFFPTISWSVGIGIDLSIKRKSNLTFLSDLARFAKDNPPIKL